MGAGEWMVGGCQRSLFSASQPAIAVLRRLLPMGWSCCAALRLAAVGLPDGAWGRGGIVKDEPSRVGADDCPAWCVIQHDVACDECDDAHLPVAGVIPQRGHGSDGGPERRAVPTELYLVHYQRAGEADEWVYVGDGHHGLDISP